MDPPHDCGWIHFCAALLHYLRQIAVADPILAVLANTNQNDLDRKTTTLEHNPILTFLHLPSSSKMYGNGRVFYSTLGHTEDAWEDPDIRKMYFEAIKWALGLTEGSTVPHARPVTSGQTP